MRLYHFTAMSRLKSIQERGIVKGDVATSPSEGFNAPWLTRNSNHNEQGWQAKEIAHEDKTTVRLTVEVPDGIHTLRHWPELAKELEIEDWWYAALDKSGSGGSEDWYVFLGTIPYEWVTNVEMKVTR